MQDRLKTAAAVVLVGALIGLLVARRHELGSMFRVKSAQSAAPAAPTARAGWGGAGIPAVLRARELQILGSESSPLIQLGTSGEGSPVLWISNPRKRGLVELGIRANGFPMVIVSDGAVRNFGLGRVDGKNASPILVFRRDDVVRAVFGLSMTEPGRPAFLVQYTSDGGMHEVLGRYCDRPDRACSD